VDGLVILSGLPASGKTTVGRALARELGAVHLRVDTIEQAIVRAGTARHPVGVVGYAVAYALAGDHLRQGLSVVAESVNPLAVTRRAWREVARTAGVAYLDVEVVCSDPAEHERRATTRVVDIPDLPLPTWADIEAREYEPWTEQRCVVDTARLGVAESVALVLGRLRPGRAASAG
jgi:predicted kinase